MNATTARAIKQIFVILGLTLLEGLTLGVLLSHYPLSRWQGLITLFLALFCGLASILAVFLVFVPLRQVEGLLASARLRADRAEAQLRAQGVGSATWPMKGGWSPLGSAQEVEDALHAASSLLLMSMVGTATPPRRIEALWKKVETARGHMVIVTRKLSTAE